MSRKLSEQLLGLPEESRQLLQRHRFEDAWLLRLAQRLQTEHDPGDTNRVRGAVRAPEPGDVAELPESGSERARDFTASGRKALVAGEWALVVLAGGMATRMGGLVKALVEVLEGRTFLDLRLAERRALGRLGERQPPLWLMTSHATEGGIRQALGAELGGDAVQTFVQNLALRLTPDGDLLRDASGQPSLYAPGHGDLPDALRASGLLERFVEGGGRWLTVTNIDNLGAGIDPLIMGWHRDHGAAVTCEVVDKWAGDRGGIPVRLDERPVVLEEFRLPQGFEAASVPVFNTNTFHFDARALLELKMGFTFFTVNKSVDGAQAIQFERLLGEVTSHLETRFLRVPRDGVASRFLPVKDFDELARRRPEIESVARGRGWL